jgi:hypothetical protein
MKSVCVSCRWHPPPSVIPPWPSVTHGYSVGLFGAECRECHVENPGCTLDTYVGGVYKLSQRTTGQHLCVRSTLSTYMLQWRRSQFTWRWKNNNKWLPWKHKIHVSHYCSAIYRMFIVQTYQTSQYAVPHGDIFLGKWRSSFAGNSDVKINVQSACALNTRYILKGNEI